jgi:hypothetical protein
MSTTANTKEKPLGTELPRGIGVHGQVAVTWAAAGGILLGGVLVALMTLAGRLSGHGLFFTVSGLFVIGAVLGLAHGMVLGFLGRPAGVGPRRATGDLGRALLYAVPTLAVAWLTTVWIGMTMPAVLLGRVFTLAGVGLAWLVGLAVVSTAAVYGWRSLKNAYARWAEPRLGTALTAASFAALLVLFLADRPELWGVRLRVTEVGAVLLAASLTLWFVGPAVTVALRLTRQTRVLPDPTQVFARGAAVAGDLGIGLLVGAVLGVLAVPFLGVTVPAGATAGAVVAAVSQAFLDEVLLRVVLLSLVAWLLLRWHRVHAEEAAIAAVLLTAAVQVLLYTPGIQALGFPTTFGALGFGLVTVALPAVAFGILYWKRGLGAALTADVTAVTAMLLLAI